MKLEEIAIIVGTRVVETKNYNGWLIHIVDVGVKNEGTLTGALGMGRTQTEARKTLVKNAHRSNRWEVTLPMTISVRK